eukprot:jgi/Psemu1/196649/e_gw1.190.83.1
MANDNTALALTLTRTRTLTGCLIAGLVAVFCWFCFAPGRRRTRDGSNDERPKKVVYAFFHPYASGGGGGERVLWKMIQFLHIPKPVRLVSLEEHKDCLSPRPFLSMVMESWGTMRLAREALLATLGEASNKKEDPNTSTNANANTDSEFIFCDTTGCAFTFVVVWWMRRCFPATTTTRILAYVHYPTISTDMMAWEWERDRDNRSIQRRIRTCIKLAYYYFFAVAYGLTGSLADLVMVNSTWTYNHIHALWRFGMRDRKQRQPIEIVYPPCRVPDRQQQQRENTIVSIGQFRPEKNHKLQIEALSVLLKTHPEICTTADDKKQSSPVKLLLIGSCRNDADRGRVEELRKMVKDLELGDHVVFNINPPYSELQASMFRAKIGIHTMRQEHFGIGIVEMMAAGLLTIAHDSGGPKSDIVLPGNGNRNGNGNSDACAAEGTATGFLATTAEQYAEAMHRALATNDVDAEAMRRRARTSATRFSDAAFDQRLERVLPLLYQYS